jgi:sugar lactone lactonase YvrE
VSRSRGRRSATIAIVAVASIAVPSAEAAWEQAREWPLVAGDPKDGLAIGAGGDVFVTRNSSVPGRPLEDDPHVLRFDRNGKQVARWGATGTGPGQLESPDGIATDAAGQVYVSDGVSQLDVFTADGAVVASSRITADNGDDLVMLDVHVDRATGERYVAHAQSGISQPDGVIRFDAAGARIAAWGGEGSTPGQFDRPESLATGNGGVYVVDGGNSRVQRFTPDGAFVSEWGGSGSEPGRFVHPSAIAVGPGGDVFVAETGNDRVQRFTADGRLVESIGPPRSAAIGYTPIDLDFDDQGRMYVLNDSAGDNDFVHVFAQAGGSPRSRVSLRSGSLTYRRGAVKVRLACASGAACRGKLTLRRKGVKLGSATYRLRGARQGTVRLKLSAKGRRALARSRRHRVRLELRPAGGARQVERLTLKVVAQTSEA